MKNKNGFTLVEILVVATIMVLLTAVGVTSYSVFLKQSRDVRRKADLEQIRAALEMYRSNNDEYAPSSRNNDCSYSTFEYLTTPTKYIENMPTDPKVNSNYYYRCIITENDYTLGAYLETGGSGSCSNCRPGVACNYCIGPYGQK